MPQSTGEYPCIVLLLFQLHYYHNRHHQHHHCRHRDLFHCRHCRLAWPRVQPVMHHQLLAWHVPRYASVCAFARGQCVHSTRRTCRHLHAGISAGIALQCHLLTRLVARYQPTVGARAGRTERTQRSGARLSSCQRHRRWLRSRPRWTGSLCPLVRRTLLSRQTPN